MTSNFLLFNGALGSGKDERARAPTLPLLAVRRLWLGLAFPFALNRMCTSIACRVNTFTRGGGGILYETSNMAAVQRYAA